MHVPTWGGWLAVAVSLITFGFFTVPLKLKCVVRAKVDAMVLQVFFSFGAFLLCWVPLTLCNAGGSPYQWSWYGVMGAALWVPASILSIFAIQLLGIGISQGVWSSLTMIISFMWGTLYFKQKIGNLGLTLLGFFLLLLGVLVIATSDLGILQWILDRFPWPYGVVCPCCRCVWADKCRREWRRRRRTLRGRSRQKLLNADADPDALVVAEGEEGSSDAVAVAKPDAAVPEFDDVDGFGDGSGRRRRRGVFSCCGKRRRRAEHEDLDVDIDMGLGIDDGTTSTSPSESPVPDFVDEGTSTVSVRDLEAKGEGNEDEDEDSFISKKKKDVEQVVLTTKQKIVRYSIGMTCLLIMGLFNGCIMVPARLDKGNTMYLFSYSIAVPFITALYAFIYFAAKAIITKKSPFDRKQILYGLLPGAAAGFTWAIGNYGQVFATFSPLGLTIGFPLIQTAFVICGFAGMIFFCEQGTWPKRIQFLIGALVLVVPGFFLVALFGKAKTKK